MVEIMFNCCICNYKTDNEENINYHYLWSHNQWRGNCESPNKINIKTNSFEPNSIVLKKRYLESLPCNRIWEVIFLYKRARKNPRIFNAKEGFTHYRNRQLDEIFGLLKRLDQLNWATPNILHTYNARNFLIIYNESKEYVNTNYRYTKKNVIRQRDFEDKMQKEEDLIKKLTKEVDEELMREKQKQWQLYYGKWI